MVFVLLVSADLFVTEGFCLTALWFDCMSDGFRASLFTDVDTVLLVAVEVLAPATGLLEASDPVTPATLPSRLEKAVAGITFLL